MFVWFGPEDQKSAATEEVAPGVLLNDDSEGRVIGAEVLDVSERMTRTLKEATVKRLHYETRDRRHSHLADFVTACNFARRLKTLKGLTPCESICKVWTTESERFRLDPLHQMPGLNIRRWAGTPLLSGWIKS